MVFIFEIYKKFLNFYKNNYKICYAFIIGIFFSIFMAAGNKPSGSKDSKKGKKDKGEGCPRKAEITVMLDEKQAMKIIQNSKVVTVQDLARQTGVKISAANAFLKESTTKGTVKKVGGYSGHHLYQVVSS